MTVDEAKARILEALRERGPMCAKDLDAAAGLYQRIRASALAALVKAGKVKTAKGGAVGWWTRRTAVVAYLPDAPPAPERKPLFRFAVGRRFEP